MDLWRAKRTANGSSLTFEGTMKALEPSRLLRNLRALRVEIAAVGGDRSTKAHHMGERETPSTISRMRRAVGGVVPAGSSSGLTNITSDISRFGRKAISAFLTR